MKKQLQEIEDQILKLLSEAKGDILEDETLINVLAESKKTSTEINEKVAEAEIIEKEIDETRKGYIPVAFRASLLYFCIADLAAIDSMYQYSLEWFMGLFIRGVGDASQSDILEVRLKSLNDFFTKSLYENVCRSLFECHKLLFSFLLTVRILEGDNKIDPIEWRFLVAGGAPKKDIPNPSPDFLTENVWKNILAAAELPNFVGFETSFIENLSLWREYFEAPNPNSTPLPAPWEQKLGSLGKLCVLNCMRPDKISPALQNYVTVNLGPSYIEFPLFDLELSFKESNNVSPIIFILSKGADVMSKLSEFGESQGYNPQNNNFNSISLGQGQGPKALKFIQDACKTGV
jgi:dynein heavy chain